ncbi:hypothetical protein PHAVU_002G068400 [Phaseolus vulgaris]|uniref:Uncharacterized protein n=1 Tax=Phaseolus vulgaris TaxID=3885 RepID=V7CKH6_PHAVU|nr:hypothetical protein PHAVU_002G068400g [Phaseolus vulgaris]ESW29411.1 hypothetical protein PHAVU_002G068400g [Phaseolus vulgaris]
MPKKFAPTNTSFTLCMYTKQLEKKLQGATSTRKCNLGGETSIPNPFRKHPWQLQKDPLWRLGQTFLPYPKKEELEGNEDYKDNEEE